MRAVVRYWSTPGSPIPAAIGCAGRSYGGYLTLAALVRFPGCSPVGVDVCGISDFATFYAADRAVDRGRRRHASTATRRDADAAA